MSENTQPASRTSYQPTTFAELIADEMQKFGDSLKEIVFSTLSDHELAEEFDLDGKEEVAFTVWTQKRVYFPAHYDGKHWAGSVSRVIDYLPTQPVGGG